MVSGVPVFDHIIIRLRCTQISGHIKIIYFHVEQMENLLFLGVPKLKHNRVSKFL